MAELTWVVNAPAGFDKVLVRDNPFAPGHPDMLIVKSLEMLTSACSVCASSASRFKIVMVLDYGKGCPEVSSAAKVVVDGGPTKVSFLFDHVGTDPRGTALRTCLSVIHEVLRPGGKYGAVMETAMVGHPKWTKFAAAAVKAFAKETAACTFPGPYQDALRHVFLTNGRVSTPRHAIGVRRRPG